MNKNELKNESRVTSEGLINLIRGCTKHGNYQLLPPCLPQKVLDDFKDYKTCRLDRERFGWFDKHSVFNNKNLVEIGANIGYFSFRAISECGARSTVYEPDYKLAKAMSKIADSCKLHDRINIKSEPFTLNKPTNIPRGDVLIFLNVLHHAGVDFDKNLVKSVKSWYPYAVKYLRRLTKISAVMVFQIGYTWGGGSKLLCTSDENLDLWTRKLLKEGGWRVVHCAKVARRRKARNYLDCFRGDTQFSNNLVSKSKRIIPTEVRNFASNVLNNLSKDRNRQKRIDRFSIRPIYICRRIRV